MRITCMHRWNNNSVVRESRFSSSSASSLCFPGRSTPAAELGTCGTAFGGRGLVSTQKQVGSPPLLLLFVLLRRPSPSSRRNSYHCILAILSRCSDGACYISRLRYKRGRGGLIGAQNRVKIRFPPLKYDLSNKIIS